MIIKSRVKQKESAYKLISILDEKDNCYIFKAKVVDVEILKNHIKITMWFEDSRPFDSYFSGMGVKSVKFIANGKEVEYKIKNGYFSYFNFYNLSVIGELQDVPL